MTVDKITGIKACVFDAYGTLFDVNAAAAHCAEELGDKWQALADLWRGRQLQYTWLRSLQGDYADFWSVTGDALDFAMASLQIDDEKLRARLMELYLTLDAYPEVKQVLSELRELGFKTAILSNGSPKMLDAAINHAGIGDLLDTSLSVDKLKIYKTAPQVYQMAVDALVDRPDQICFQSSNAWDAHAGAAFGFKVAWINRFGQAKECLPGDPNVELTSLHDLPKIIAA